jgi:hypothetical protein
MNQDDYELSALRRGIYALLILSTLVHVSARILTARSRDGHTPFFSANDRSRWSTISALVDYRTYAIDQVRRRPGWKSIDMVRHRGADGKQHYYSSKPPLLPTLLAPLYAAIRSTTGMTFAEQPFAIARIMLLLTNLLPLAVYLVLFTLWVERHGESDFGRVFLVACACWGTFLTPFANTLNNHLPAAICILIATLCLWRIWNEEDPPAHLFVVCGLTTALAGTNELPALSYLAVVSLTLMWLAPRKTVVWYAPMVVVVAVGFFAVNQWAHGSLRPPYAHRNAGENWYDYPGSYWIEGRRGVDLGEPSKLRYLFHIVVGHHGFFSLTPIWCLSLVGAVTWLWRGEPRRRFIAGLALGLLLIGLVFYAGLRPLGDRNYGGVASGFRWLFWLTPLWLLVLQPAADWLAESRWRQGFALLLLAVSMLSVALPVGNPWTHPWIYQCVLAWTTNS